VDAFWHLFNGSYYVTPGWHKVSVRYEKKTSTYTGYRITTQTTRSVGSVTFEHNYFFEGNHYIFTGKEVGDQINFGIDRK